jgi:putative transposase
MGTSAFQRGAIVRIDGSDFRLLRQVSTAWQLENIKTGQYVEYEHKKLLQLFVDLTLVFVTGDTVPSLVPVIDLSTEQMEIAKVRRMYVHAVLELPKTPKKMAPAILEIWNTCSQPRRRPGWVTVYRWEKRYLESGRDIRALIDNSSRKGNRKCRFPKDVIEICDKAIEAVFLRPERRTIQDTCEEAILRVREENRLRPADMSLPLPTRRLIKRLIGEIPEFDKDSARYGRDAALRKYRIVTGRRTTDAPLERAEIDHTVLDLFVLDDRTCLPLGRPYLTACIDDFSRCILGLYVGFVQPSCLSVSKCLKDAFLPKVTLRNEYPQIKHDWPSHGVMRQLVLDNGTEFHSDALDRTCFALGIEMHYSPRRQPWFKGKIERWFKTINHDFAHRIPGTSFSNILHRGDYKPAEHAVIRWSTLNTLLRQWVCDVYHERPHRALQMSPAQKWTASISPENIQLPGNLAELDLIMGRPFSRVLTHKGIEFETLFYSSPELQDLRIREGSTLNVEIRVDEDDIGHIFVIAPNSRHTIRVPAVDREYANGTSRWQHGVFRHLARESQRENNTEG